MAWDDEYDDLPGLDKKFRDDNSTVGSDTATPDDDDDGLLSGFDMLINPTKWQPQYKDSPLLGGTMQQTDDDPQRGQLQADVDEARRKRDEAYNNYDEMMTAFDEERRQQAEQLKPRYTQEELDSRRAKSEAVAMLTSALANVANGLVVGAGGLNATVPDGYKAAYEHWNDVQKRQNTRRAEYQKILDSVSQNRFAQQQAAVKRAETDYNNTVAQLYQYDKLRSTEKVKQAEIDARIKMNDDDNAAKKEIEQIKASRPSTKTGTKTSNKTSTKTEKNLENYRTFTRGTKTFQIPQGVDVEKAYAAIAAQAARLVQDSDDFDKDAKAAAIRQASTFTGSVSDKSQQIKALLKALDKAGVSDEDIQSILDGLAPQQQQQQQQQQATNTNKGTQYIGKPR